MPGLLDRSKGNRCGKPSFLFHTQKYQASVTKTEEMINIYCVVIFVQWIISVSNPFKKPKIKPDLVNKANTEPNMKVVECQLHHIENTTVDTGSQAGLRQSGINYLSHSYGHNCFPKFVLLKTSCWRYWMLWVGQTHLRVQAHLSNENLELLL